MMRLYPKGKSRIGTRPDISDDDRRISKQFGFEYFDGDRRYGYGGFNYHPRFWTDTVRLFRDHYQLAANASILDVGCAKGFMLNDFRILMPEATLAGVDVSAYAVEHACPRSKTSSAVGDARHLPFPDRSFDLVIAINTLHNLKRADCVQALREIERVEPRPCFRHGRWVAQRRGAESNGKLGAYGRDDVAVPMIGVALFAEARYTGDYFFWTVS